jgi:uncharacterized membrane protein (DUF4010 family)
MKHKTHLKIHFQQKHFWLDIILVAFLWSTVLLLPSDFLKFSFIEFHTIIKIAAIVASLELFAFFSFHLFKESQGLMLQGFLGGLVSSTAVFVKLTTPSTANSNKTIQLSMGLISATLAMLLECLLILVNFTKNQPIYIYYPILIQIVALLGYLVYLNNKMTEAKEDQLKKQIEVDHPILWMNVIKLSAFIIFLVYGMKFLNTYFHSGKDIAVFIMSLFEAHGVLAASLMAKQSDSNTFQQILLILTGHTMSKSFLVIRSKNKNISKEVVFVLFGCLALSWGLFFIY